MVYAFVYASDDLLGEQIVPYIGKSLIHFCDSLWPSDLMKRNGKREKEQERGREKREKRHIDRKRVKFTTESNDWVKQMTNVTNSTPFTAKRNH